MTARPETLFPVADTQPPRCKACGATRKNLCRHDADLEHGLISRSRRRPTSCLNGYDPKTAPFPADY